MSTIESGFYSNESGQASPEAYENMLYEEQREESLIEEPLRELNEKERRIVALASEFIIDSPPGQLMEVFNDVRVILNNDELLSHGVIEAFEAYKIENFEVVSLPDRQYKTLLTPYNKLDTGLYFDPVTNEKFVFDSLQDIAQILPETVERNIIQEPLVKAIFECVFRFVDDYFPQGQTIVTPGNGDIIHICYSAKINNPSNYWSGKWLGNWKYNLSKNSLSGYINIKVHYYENGNVQLTRNKSYDVKLAKKNPEDIGKEIEMYLTKFNNDIKTDLSENFSNLSENSVKLLRRALPITKTKVDWDKITAVTNIDTSKSVFY